ncbi:MAG: restriction endonuclease [Candidatus Marinimicrobia bacterium]|nr:restriction endonuclease [Candidatus Neomarinimicrobiota bacterium]
MKIEVKSYVDRLFKRNEKQIDLSNEIVDALRREGLSELEAVEKSEEVIKRVKKAINKKLKYYKRLALTPKYVFDDLDDDYLIRTDLVVEKNKEDIRKILEWKDQIFEILKKVTWDEFERVCKLVLQLNGVQPCNVTRGRKDGGVDVYGWLVCPESKRIFRGLKFRVICQGKHKKSGAKVGDADIGEFITDIDRLRKKQGFSLFVLPDEFLNSHSPLISVFITNGHYSSESINMAQEYGVILWNGDQISEDIARYLDLSAFIVDGKIDYKKFREYINRV